MLPALPACDWQADKPIAVAAHAWVGYESMFLARDEGWLDPQQVRLLETRSASASLRALAQGQVQGAALTLDEVLRARAGGLPLSVVLVFDVSAGADMLLARAGIEKLTDIKGRRLGYEQGTTGELMLLEVMRAAGLSRQDITLVPLAIDQQRAAWSRKEVDALISYEPVASQLLAQDATRLFDSRKTPNTIVDVLALRCDALEPCCEAAVRHLIEGHFRALENLAGNPRDAAYRMTRHLDLPLHQVLSAFKGLVQPGVARNYRLLAGATPELLASARQLSSVMVRNQLLKQEDSLNLLLRPDFLPTDFSLNRL